MSGDRPELSTADSLLDAVLRYGGHTAEAAVAAIRGDKETAVASNRRSLEALGRFLDAITAAACPGCQQSSDAEDGER